MNETSFDARPTKSSASFRLRAPAARRVDLVLDKKTSMQRGADGWFSADVFGARAGTLYKYRIDDELDVPDRLLFGKPAKALKPWGAIWTMEVV